MPIEIMFGSPTPPTSSSSEYAGHLQKQLESAYQRVRDKLGHKLDRQKDLYDRKVHGKPYNVGELVWLHSPAMPRGQARKLRRPWTGPFRVVRRISEATYRIENVWTRRQRLVVHFDRCKLCPPDMRLPEPMLTHSQREAREDSTVTSRRKS